MKFIEPNTTVNSNVPKHFWNVRFRGGKLNASVWHDLPSCSAQWISWDPPKSLKINDFLLFFIDFHWFPLLRVTSRVSMVLNQAQNLRKPENLIPTFWNASETFVSERENSLQRSGMICRRVRLNEFHGILQNPWKSMIFIEILDNFMWKMSSLCEFIWEGYSIF